MNAGDYINDMLGTVVQASKAEGYDVLARVLAETRKELDGVCGALGEARGELVEVKDKLAKSREELDGVFVELAAGMAERDKTTELLRNLLARVHRDGGHYAAHYGLMRASEEAEAVWVRGEVEREEVRGALMALTDSWRELFDWAGDRIAQDQEGTHYCRACGQEMEDSSSHRVDCPVRLIMANATEFTLAEKALAKTGGGE